MLAGERAPGLPRGGGQARGSRGPPRPIGEYASWGRRGLALILDNVLLLALAGVFFGLIFVPNDLVSVLAAILAFFSWLVLPFVYFTAMHGQLGGGQTIGKRALGIGVRRAETGEVIGYGAAFGRYAIVFLFSIFTLPVLLDYLFPLWDRQNQALHDKVATSVVMRV
jgi:uncharacterized RDD family membrane protein YckC